MSLARLRALVVVVVLAVCAAVLVTVALTRDRQADADAGEKCPPNAVPVNLRLPSRTEEIKVNVYNATDKPGLANQVGEEFRSRKFTVINQASDPTGRKLQGVAQVRYGPKTVGTAWVVRTYFLNEADLVFDINRKDDVVDVVVGANFLQLGSPTEVNQALSAAGTPRLPEGTCDPEAT